MKTKKFRKCMQLLFSFLILIGAMMCLNLPVQAANKISEVSIQIPTPVTGTTVTQTGIGPLSDENGEKHFGTIVGDWMEYSGGSYREIESGSELFKANTKYKMTIYVFPMSGYSFEGAIPSINIYGGNRIPSPGYYVSYGFTSDEGFNGYLKIEWGFEPLKEIRSVSVSNIQVPVKGDKTTWLSPGSQLAVPSGAHYTAQVSTDSMLSPREISGNKLRYFITFTAKDGYHFVPTYADGTGVSVMINGQQAVRHGANGGVMYTGTEITYLVDIDEKDFYLSKNPSPASTLVGESFFFSVEAGGVSKYEWCIVDSEYDEQPYGWDYIGTHAGFTGTKESLVEIMPTDTWLDDKYIYCNFYGKDGKFIQKSKSVKMTVKPNPSANDHVITLISIDNLNEPVVGENPDFNISLGSNTELGIQKNASVVWKEFTDFGTPAQKSRNMSSSDVFLAGNRYYCYLELKPSGNDSFKVRTETDDYGDEYKAFDGWVKINGVQTVDLAQYIDYQGVLHFTWWKKEAVEPPHVHSYVNKTTKATLTKNGKIEKVCECGDIASTKIIYSPVNFDLSDIKYTYDGKAKTPTLTILDTDHEIISTTYYTVTKDSGRKNVGKYNYKITFKGRYSGTKTISFTIVPKGTTLSKLTAKSKAFAITWTKNATQTTGYQIQYGLKSDLSDQKTVTITSNATTSKTISSLKAKKKYYVRIRTYKTVSGTKYYSSWSAKKTITTK